MRPGRDDAALFGFRCAPSDNGFNVARHAAQIGRQLFERVGAF
jgi:hypothetical protein